MDETLILKRLDLLSEEIQSLKSDVSKKSDALAELKQDLAPIIKQATPHVMTFFADIEGEYSNEDLARLLKNLLMNVRNLNSALDMLKAGMELKEDLGPVTKLTLPKLTEFMGELEGQFDTKDLVALVRRLLTNLEHFNSALDMLKAGMELKEDVGPVIKQILPKVTDFMAELNGEFNAEELLALVRKLLTNLDNFNTAMDMLKAGMELKEDMMPIIKQILPKVIDFMNELDQRGVFKIANRIMDAASGSENQLGMMCNAIEEIDLGKPYFIGPVEIMNEIRDPNVQETIGFAFKIMRAVGCCLRANRMRQMAEDYPEEMPVSSMGS